MWRFLEISLANVVYLFEGFDSFDVPNFRPPSDDSLTKTYALNKKYGNALLP